MSVDGRAGLGTEPEPRVGARAGGGGPAVRRDLLLLAAGQLTSTTGDAAALVALLLRVRPAGSGWVAALLVAELVPMVVLAPAVGRIVDRFETRRMLLLGLAGQAVVAVPLALLSGVWAGVLLFAALNCLGALVRPAAAALVPAITGPGGTGRGYARVGLGSSLGWVIGPALGGLLTAGYGSVAALLVDAASFAVMAALCLGIRTRRARPVREAEPGDARGGMGLLWRDRVLRIGLLGSTVAIACGVVDNVAAPFRFVEQLRVGDAGYGAYLTVWGLGAVLGSQLPTPLRGRWGTERESRILAVGNLLSGAGIGVIGLAPSYAVALLASAVGGIGNGIVNVSTSAFVSGRTPARMHGRAFAATSSLLNAGVGAGTMAGAPLVSGLGAAGAMIAAGGMTVSVAAVALLLGSGNRERGKSRGGPPGASRTIVAMATTRRADMFTADGKPSADDPREGGPRLGDERTTLVEALRCERLTLELKCAGLDEQAMARRSVEPSTMSLLGLVRHLAEMERATFRVMLAGQDVPALFCSETDRDGDFDGAVPDPQVVTEAWEAWRSEVDFATRFVDAAPSLDITGDDPLNQHGSGGGRMSLREALVGMLEEYARHLGHVDLLRERIDGRVGQ